MKRGLLLLFPMLLIAAMLLACPQPASAYSNNNMIDNSVFDNKNDYSQQNTRDFIAAQATRLGRGTCLTTVGVNYGGGNVFLLPKDYWTYGPELTDAAGVIYAAAQYSGVNPKVIIATLQKEQSLMTDNDCFDNYGYGSLNKAMGYFCTESGPCPQPGYEGFEKQVMKGTWQLAHDRHRSEGDTSWGSATRAYVGPMTAGDRKSCAADTCLMVYYDGYNLIDGQSVFVQNGATAALYNYTPHLNQSFPVYYQQFFGVDPAVPISAYPPWVVFRAFNKYNGKHLYTMDVNEWKNSPKFGYAQENYVFIQYPSETNAPLWRLNNPQKKKYFYTTSYAEADYAARRLGYIIEGVAFNVEPTVKQGLKPVYRVYNPYIDDHLFTLSTTERDQALTQKSYINEGIAWYSY